MTDNLGETIDNYKV